MGHRAWATSDEYGAAPPRDGLPARAIRATGGEGVPLLDAEESPEQAVDDWVAQRRRVERAGRRKSVETERHRGRYTRARVPVGELRDLALDATLRAAARHGPREGARVRVDDLRQKVRAERIGRLLVFVLDLSGSMGAELLALARRAAGHLLEEAYLRRDRVGVVAFRGTSAEIVFAPTSSVELARARLSSLPSGGKTPLASGLEKGWALIRRASRRDRAVEPVLVVITDGQGNVGSRPGYPAILAEIDRVASALRAEPRLRTLVFDATEEGKNRFHATRLATALGARSLEVHRLRRLDEAALREVLRHV